MWGFSNLALAVVVASCTAPPPVTTMSIEAVRSLPFSRESRAVLVHGHVEATEHGLLIRDVHCAQKCVDILTVTVPANIAHVPQVDRFLSDADRTRNGEYVLDLNAKVRVIWIKSAGPPGHKVAAVEVMEVLSERLMADPRRSAQPAPGSSGGK